MSNQGPPSGELPPMRKPEKPLAHKPPEVEAPKVTPLGQTEQAMVTRIDKDGDPDLVLQDLTKAEVGQNPPTTPDTPTSAFRKVEVPTLAKEKATLREKIVGQEDAINTFAALHVKIKSGIRSTKPGPVDAIFLAGPSGVGKTELVYTLADSLAEGDPDARKKVLKLNGGEYQPEQRHNLARLLGAPPGYRGSEDPAEPGSGAKIIFSQENLDSHRIFYTDRNGQQKSVILILVDEAEKADRSFHMAFLSILDKGEMDLTNNTKADFRDAVVFYTSNIGNDKVEQLHRERGEQTGVPEPFQEVAEEALFSGEDKALIRNEFAQAFPPEFRGRIQETIVFNHLGREAIQKIAQLKVKEVEEAFAESGIRIGLDLTPEALQWLTKNGYSRSEGARGMDKVVRKRIMEQLIKFDATKDIDVLSTGIHRKRVGLGVSEDGTELEFYFGEGYQLEEFPPTEHPAPLKPAAGRLRLDLILGQPKNNQFVPNNLRKKTATSQQTETRPQQAQAAERPRTPEIPQIPERFKTELLSRLTQNGIRYYVSERDNLAQKGLLDPNAANMQPEVRLEAAKRALSLMEKSGVKYYQSELEQIVEAGILTAETVNNWSPVKKAATIRLQDKLPAGVNAFINERDQLVAAGIGTVEEWNKLLH